MHGAQLQQIHLGFVNYISELYNQLVYISISAERFQKGRVRARYLTIVTFITLFV